MPSVDIAKPPPGKRRGSSWSVGVLNLPAPGSHAEVSGRWVSSTCLNLPRFFQTNTALGRRRRWFSFLALLVDEAIGGCPRLASRDQGRGGVASSWCRQVWRSSVLTLLDAKGRHCEAAPREAPRKFVVGGCPQLVLTNPFTRFQPFIRTLASREIVRSEQLRFTAGFVVGGHGTWVASEPSSAREKPASDRRARS
jgi:hypothetical protein